MRKLDQLGARKVDHSKQCRTRRAERKRGSWEKNVEKERGDDGN